MLYLAKRVMRSELKTRAGSASPVGRYLPIGLLLLLYSSQLLGASWQTEIKPGLKDNFTKAAFSLWLDETAPPPVALLVIVPGWNGDGRGAVNDAGWQAYARKQQLGLMGVYLQSNERDDQTPPYHVADQGSGAAFLNAISQLARDAKRPQLARAGLLILGHSAGGQFGYGMACYAPERIIAFAAIKGGYYFSKPKAATFHTPELFIIGERDEAFRAINITKTFAVGRSKAAPWCMAFEPNSGHEEGKSNDLILPFFSGVLAIRGHKNNAPVSANDSSGYWVGIRSSLEINNANEVSTQTDGILRTVWLPDKITAQAWRIFSGGGGVSGDLGL